MMEGQEVTAPMSASLLSEQSQCACEPMRSQIEHRAHALTHNSEPAHAFCSTPEESISPCPSHSYAAFAQGRITSASSQMKYRKASKQDHRTELSYLLGSPSHRDSMT